jgi:hypothetical protein
MTLSCYIHHHTETHRAFFGEIMEAGVHVATLEGAIDQFLTRAAMFSHTHKKSKLNDANIPVSF